jgi:hypothetical protein
MKATFADGRIQCLKVFRRLDPNPERPQLDLLRPIRRRVDEGPDGQHEGGKDDD